MQILMIPISSIHTYSHSINRKTTEIQQLRNLNLNRKKSQIQTPQKRLKRKMLWKNLTKTCCNLCLAHSTKWWQTPRGLSGLPVECHRTWNVPWKSNSWTSMTSRSAIRRRFWNGWRSSRRLWMQPWTGTTRNCRWSKWPSGTRTPSVRYRKYSNRSTCVLGASSWTWTSTASSWSRRKSTASPTSLQPTQMGLIYARESKSMGPLASSRKGHASTRTPRL